MWSWWDCMQWWNGTSVWDGSASWLTFLPMMLWPVVMVGGIVVLVALLMRGSTTTPPPSAWRRETGRQTPFDILRERFARGEIDQQEYEDRKGLLSQP